MSKQTLKEYFKDYSEKVIPENAGKGQRDDLETAFYAGVVSTFELITSVKSPDDIRKISNEIDCFIEKIGNEIK